MPENDQIINRLLKNSAEVITAEELKEKLASGRTLNHYIGFEISGYVHIGQGIMTALVIKDLIELGVNCTVWLADWHTYINDKLDEKKDTARKIGQGYFAEGIKAALLSVGCDPNKVEFRLASERYEQDAMKFWETVVAVSKNTTISRMMRSIDILGRKEGGDVDYAKTIYPAMQVADIFYQDIDIAHAGMDQRKAHVVMRDVADKVAPNKGKPVALHHPLLIGLQKPPVWPVPEEVNKRDVIAEMKMSKSKPDSAIWIHDAPEEIERKIKKAFCPEKEIDYNPILNWADHVLFWDRRGPLRVERKPEYGGNLEFDDYKSLETSFASGELHPMDLKAAVTREITELLAPAREHFSKPEVAAKKEELDKVLENR